MSELADRLRKLIRLKGPVTFQAWMKAALYDSAQGYYSRLDRERWGRAGDYRTAPERSFLFGATFARYFAELYESLGSSQNWTILESGGGEGYFAETVLKTLQKRFPGIFSSTRYVFDELSDASQSRAKQRLESFGDHLEYKRLHELENLNPGIVFANELIDAFPIHRMTMEEGRLKEFYVGLNDDGSFEWLAGEPSDERLTERIARLQPGLAEGQVMEINLEVEDWLQTVSQKIQSGYLVLVDYGAECEDLLNVITRRSGTLRAFQRHQFADDILKRPGELDITTTIDWGLIKELSARNGFEVVGFHRLDQFLMETGLLEEMELAVSEANAESEKQRLRSLAREMILPGGMAENFQVLIQRKKE